jgi:hypothetical protein
MSAKAGPSFELSLRELDRLLLELRPPFWPWDTQGAMERRLVKMDENKILPTHVVRASSHHYVSLGAFPICDFSALNSLS